jgi:hypothetical protein
MPRRAPESVQEIRYEYSLGPKEQGLVEELETSMNMINKAAMVSAVVTPVGLAALGYGVYQAGKWLGMGIANFSLGVESLIENTPAGMLAKEISEKTGVETSVLDFGLLGQLAKAMGLRGDDKS